MIQFQTRAKNLFVTQDAIIAHQFLMKRNINFDTVKDFELGYSNFYSSGFNNLINCIIISCRNQHGGLATLFGRKIDGSNGKYQFMSGYKKSESVFGIYQAKESIVEKGYVIIVEGLLDVMSLHQLGYRNVVAAPGKDWHLKQVALLRRYTSNCVLLLDNDEIGIKYSFKYVQMFKDLGFYTNKLFTPGFKDIDEMIREHKDKALQFLNTKVTKICNI